MVVSLFTSSDHGTIVQDVFSLTPAYTRLLGIQVPFFYLLNSPETQRQVCISHKICALIF